MVAKLALSSGHIQIDEGTARMFAMTHVHDGDDAHPLLRCAARPTPAALRRCDASPAAVLCGVLCVVAFNNGLPTRDGPSCSFVCLLCAAAGKAAPTRAPCYTTSAVPTRSGR